MEDFQQILPITRVKRDLLALVKKIQEEDETIALTRNGEPVGVMMGFNRYEALLETIEILGDKKILKALEKSKKDYDSGKVFDDDEVWEE